MGLPICQLEVAGIAEDSMELVTMKNGRHALRRVAVEDRSVNVFHILGNAEVEAVRAKLGGKEGNAQPWRRLMDQPPQHAPSSLPSMGEGVRHHRC